MFIVYGTTGPFVLERQISWGKGADCRSRLKPLGIGFRRRLQSATIPLAKVVRWIARRQMILEYHWIISFARVLSSFYLTASWRFSATVQ